MLEYRVYDNKCKEYFSIKSVSFSESGDICSLVLFNKSRTIVQNSTDIGSLVFEKLVSYDKNCHPIYENDVVSGIVNIKKRKNPDLFVVREVDDSVVSNFRT